MLKRYVSLWFRHLLADWKIRTQPELKEVPFVFSVSDHGRMKVKAVSKLAHLNGIYPGMIIADCRAIHPELEVLNDVPGQEEKLLTAIAEWCIRFTPFAGVDLPDSIVLDASGCAHLWGGEAAYLKEILTRLNQIGYNVSGAMADTIGAAWAVTHYGVNGTIVPPSKQAEAIKLLPPDALRLEPAVTSKLERLGLNHINSFINISRPSLRSRFGQDLLGKMDRALGKEISTFKPVRPIEPYVERLPCIDSIRTAVAIELALKELLEHLCLRLGKEHKGIRVALLKAYRVDGNEQQIRINTSKATRNTEHLFKLFQLRISSFKPDLGFELFSLHGVVVEDMLQEQGAMWQEQKHDLPAVAELLDKLGGKFGMGVIHRYLPAEHYWPERSIREAASIEEQPSTEWRNDTPRPLHLLAVPERILVTAPIPDNPPMLFRYKGEIHQVKRADGPERIEQEWWVGQDIFRDYYCVEDETGKRYWLFRAGHYHEGEPEWFLHGYFA